MTQNTSSGKLRLFFTIIGNAIRGKEMDFTTGSIRMSLVLLAIPMMLEMAMESVFALVDLYFVGHLSNSKNAIQTVGLTESVLTILYSIAIGMSMAATAVVARRVGEKDPKAASRAGMQAIVLALGVTLPIALCGVLFGTDLLLLLGADAATAAEGTPFIRIMMGSSFVIMLLFLINGIFRGAGNAAIAMKSLWVANIANIILCPILINGFGPVPAYGLTGAAIATTIGRSIGVSYQLYHLFNGKSIIQAHLAYLVPDFKQIRALVTVAAPGILQFVIASCSWIFLAELVATTGHSAGSAGYQTAIRIMMFFMLPAWGMSGAAATLVGQNLGAGQPDRAETSVMRTVKYNVIYMAIVTAISLLGAEWIVGIFSPDPEVREIAKTAVRVICSGYIFYGIGMVMLNAFNGAGDTRTPTWVNLVGFWLIQIPLAYLLAKGYDLGPLGVFIAIPVAETLMTVACLVLFRRGKWKLQKV